VVEHMQLDVALGRQELGKSAQARHTASSARNGLVARSRPIDV
jgi:hypothetical protein